MPPPKSFQTSKPHNVKVTNVTASTDWRTPSHGRHHIFLFDGTWNDETGINPANFTWDQERQMWVSRADPTQAFAPVVTNVVKTHLSLAPDGPTQLTHYFRGVGNDDEFDRANTLAEGAFAHFEPSIRNAAYVEFLKNYHVGDQISILGFSRGAASARLFARDLAARGFREKLMIESRYTSVRNSGELRHEIWATWPRGKPRIAGKDLPIAFLGAWDTVATTVRAKAADWTLPDNVARAVHCVALDETRVLYRPTLFNYPVKRAADVKEVWFPGAHSDVGGGYFCDALGRVTLDFMWRCWNHAASALELPELNWRPQIATNFTTTAGLPWLRHSQVKTEAGLLVEPRECVALHRTKPRVHPSVERFIQQGGLQFCDERGEHFPPLCVITSPPVYQPVGYPGAEAVELYDSTAWD